MSSYLLQILSVIAAFFSLGCAVFVALRAGRWRQSDEVKAILDRVASVETDVGGLKVRIQDMPTKADFEGLKSDMRAVGREVSKVDDAVVRIESYLLGRAVK